MEKINVTAVSYLNTKPFLFGLEQSGIMKKINLVKETPALVAESLISGKATIGLLPVAVIQEISGAQIISDFGIACNGAVGSVCIYSQVPLIEINTIFLDYQSRTSVELAKILMRDFWKINPEFKKSTKGYESEIRNNVAGLIIGDRALQLKSHFAYCYDLGEAWKEFTGLPFVFASWVTNESLPSEFLKPFNAALQFGVDHIKMVADSNQPDYPGIDTLDYLSNKIQYQLTAEMKKGMQLFLEESKSIAAI
ncbi:MAG: menaquinone biosynthesis protein [Chitinophagales bacterium]